MKKRKKFIMIVLSLFVLLLLITAIQMIVQPYRRPTAMVRNHILRITPLGTSIEDVVSILESREDFGLLHINLERGFTSNSPWSLVDGQPVAPSPIGEMHVSTGLGIYRAWYKWFPLILEWSVGVSWGFDENGQLIEVQIVKHGMS